MKKLIIIFCFFQFICPLVVTADKIKGHFNCLPLMKETAQHRGDTRSARNIDYVYNTPQGEYFEVDTQSPPPESMIYKINKTRQIKPLEMIKDEKMIIYYYRIVEPFVQEYYSIVDQVQSKIIPVQKAEYGFENLNRKHGKDLGAFYRAIGAMKAKSGNINKAISYAEKAIEVNKNDSKAYGLLSIFELAKGDESESNAHLKTAKIVDPGLATVSDSWEIQFAFDHKPKILENWVRMSDSDALKKLSP